MSDLISREKLKDDIAVLLERNDKLIDEWLANCIDDVIDEQPTVDLKPHVHIDFDAIKKGIEERTTHGHWILSPVGWKCSNCGDVMIVLDAEKDGRYCPHCGARMEGGKDDADE